MSSGKQKKKNSDAVVEIEVIRMNDGVKQKVRGYMLYAVETDRHYRTYLTRFIYLPSVPHLLTGWFYAGSLASNSQTISVERGHLQQLGTIKLSTKPSKTFLFWKRIEDKWQDFRKFRFGQVWSALCCTVSFFSTL